MGLGPDYEVRMDITAVAFTRNYAAYTDADTWRPSWAPGQAVDTEVTA